MTQQSYEPQATSLHRYYSEIGKHPMLDKKREKELLTRWVHHKDPKAYEELIASHLRLVAKMAAQLKGYGLPMMDLIGEGNEGLVKALHRFDLAKNVRFSTYAMWWIRSGMMEYVLRSWSIVRVGTTATRRRLFFGLRRVKQKLGLTEHTDLTADQATTIGNELAASATETVAMNRRLIGNDPSLNATDENGNEYLNALADASPSVEQEFVMRNEQQWQSDLVRKAVATLDERTQDIMTRRWLGEKQQTLEEVGNIHNISRERVRQIEAKALKQITKFVKQNAH